MEGAGRTDGWESQGSVIWEASVNALVDRDYSFARPDLMPTIYAYRFEIQSPGRRPDTVTVESVKAGMRYARNQTLFNVMRDYDYVEIRSMGVCSRIVPGMRTHEGIEPDLSEEGPRFTVRLRKGPKST